MTSPQIIPAHNHDAHDSEMNKIGSAAATENRRSSGRRSGVRVDYKRLAGETTGYYSDSDASLTPASSKNTTEDNITGGNGGQQHANKHVVHVLGRSFGDASAIVQTVADGSLLTSSALKEGSKFSPSRPILVTDRPESIGMAVPAPTPSSQDGISMRQMGEWVGMDHPVTVMDVRTQEELDGWIFRDLVEYFEDDDRTYGTNSARVGVTGSSGRTCTATGREGLKAGRRVLNQISLEFSATPLRAMVRSPTFVRELDWIDNAWPSALKQEGDYPAVQYYCLTSTAGCYTDFHLDFGGTSVWYHVLSGSKTFLLIPPTQPNLEQYEKWLCSSSQPDIFFPDLPGVHGCVKTSLRCGQTLFIPTGWIHAVYTPEDAIVIGGNFLHGLDMPRQLNVHCLETRTRVPAKFRFPHFIRAMFFAGAEYVTRMRRGEVCAAEVKGLPRLVDALRTWVVSLGNGANSGGRRGDLDKTAGNIAVSAATEAASTAGFSDIHNMLGVLESEMARVEVAGICPNKDFASKKLKIRIGGNNNNVVPSGSPETPSATNAPPRKLKIRLSGSPANEANVEKTGGEDDDGDDDDDDDDDEDTPDFQITLSPSVCAPPALIHSPTESSKRKRKRSSRVCPADLASSSDRDLVQNDGDEEWVPGDDDGAGSGSTIATRRRKRQASMRNKVSGMVRSSMASMLKDALETIESDPSESEPDSVPISLAPPINTSQDTLASGPKSPRGSLKRSSSLSIKKPRTSGSGVGSPNSPRFRMQRSSLPKRSSSTSSITTTTKTSSGSSAVSCSRVPPPKSARDRILKKLKW